MSISPSLQKEDLFNLNKTEIFKEGKERLVNLPDSSHHSGTLNHMLQNL